MASKDQLKELASQRLYDRTQAWNDAGIIGSDVPMLIAESESSPHGQGSVTRITELGSSENIFVAALSGSASKLDYGFVYKGETVPAEKFISENGIKVITRSISGPADSGTEVSAFWIDLRDRYNLYIVNSGGNDDERKTVNSAFPLDVATQVSARTMKGYQTYSSEGVNLTDIDFCEFVGYLQGTSFAAPGHAAKARLVKSRYDKEMCYDELFKYFVMCAEDMKTEGQDIYTGYGLPRLPELSRKYITMDVGENSFKINGSVQTMDTMPVNNAGNVFVPVRAISESFGMVVDWDAETKTIMMTSGSAVVKMTVGSIYMFRNGTKTILNLPPYIDANGRTMVPVRAIAQAFGCKVDWVEKKQRVMILEK